MAIASQYFRVLRTVLVEQIALSHSRTGHAEWLSRSVGRELFVATRYVSTKELQKLLGRAVLLRIVFRLVRKAILQVFEVLEEGAEKTIFAWLSG